MRMLTSEARIDAHRFRSGFLSEQDYGRLTPALAHARPRRRCSSTTRASIGVLEMRAKARRLKAEHGLHLLVVDYIQLMQGRGRFDNRQQELASISRVAQGARQGAAACPIVALSQLSRAPDARADHRPQLSDLRESGALEQDADVVHVHLPRGAVRAEGRRPRASPRSSSASSATGPTGTVKLAFIKEHTRFENLEWRQSYGAGRPSRAWIWRRSGAICRASRRTWLGARARAPGAPAARRDRRGQGERLRPRRRARSRSRSRRPARAMLACADIEEGVELREARRPRADPGVRRARRQRSRRRVRARPDADDLDAVGGCGPRARGGGARRARCAVTCKIDTGMHRLGLPRRQPARGRCRPCSRARTSRSRRSTPTSPPPTCRRTRCSPSSSARFARGAAGARGAGPARRPCACGQQRRAACATSARGSTCVRPGLLLYGIVPPPLGGPLPLSPRSALRQPGRRGQGAAAGRRASATARASTRRRPGAWRSCRPATPMGWTCVWRAVARCSSAAAARRSSARCAWT